MSPRLRAKASFVVIAVSIIGTLAALEFTVRVIQKKRYGATIGQPQALRDRFAAWRNNPRFGRVDIQHNAQGFRRTADLSVPKPAGVSRVFLLGGSAAYGAQGGFAHIDNRWNRIYNHQLIDANLERRLNASVLSRRWEVINAATDGYRIHQQLASIESRVLRYRPDYVVLMDGYNDFISMFHAALIGRQAEFDVYDNTYGTDEFNALANPGSMGSILVFANAWVRTNSALAGAIERHIPGAVRDPSSSFKKQRSFQDPVRFSDLTPPEQAAATVALDHWDYYTHTACQINRILQLDGISPIFLLQPILILSHKPFTKTEQQMFQYEREQGGPLYFYLFREIYDRLATKMAEAARKNEFTFVDQRSLFDQTAEQTFTDFAHLTPDANRIIAEELFNIIRDSSAKGAHPGSTQP